MILLVLAGVYAVLHLFLYATQSKSEPFVLSAKIPFLESAVAMGRKKTQYFVELRYGSVEDNRRDTES